MSNYNRSPVYNLKAVLKETGLTADVLRAWERRYKMPMPQRTPGGHRLYSEYDVEMVLWLQARQAEGLSISRAVQLWREISESGRDPLAETRSATTAAAREFLHSPQAHIESLRHGWINACLAFDERKAEEVLTQGFAMYPVETVCIDILQRGLSSIGKDWYLDKATVQQEHFASALVVRRLEALISTTPQPTRSQTVLIGCPAGEWHSIPVLLLSLLLRRRGLGIIYLGANIAIERLEETTAMINPNLIILAAQQLTTAASLRIAALALQNKEFPFAYGGLVFNRIPELEKYIPGHYLGEKLDESIQQIEQFLIAPRTFVPKRDVEEPDQILARLFQEKRPLIELRLQKILPQGEPHMEYHAEANTFFSSGLAAALEFGDPSLLEADLSWVQRLLTRRRIPADTLIPYLAAYRQAVESEMGSAAAPITDWIATYIDAYHSDNP